MPGGEEVKHREEVTIHSFYNPQSSPNTFLALGCCPALVMPGGLGEGGSFGGALGALVG